MLRLSGLMFRFVFGCCGHAWLIGVCSLSAEFWPRFSDLSVVRVCLAQLWSDLNVHVCVWLSWSHLGDVSVFIVR